MNKIRTTPSYLYKDLIEYKPKSWGYNIPSIDYPIRLKDIVPAISGVIGKVSLVAAFTMAWFTGLNLSDPSFIAENVRLEIVLGGILTLIFCAFLNPYIAPPGTHAPIIPLVPLMAAAGVHPLPFGLMVGALGLALSALRYFNKIVQINGQGTKSGIILLFGLMGIQSSLSNLKVWAGAEGSGTITPVLMFAGVLVYLMLIRFKARWLTIPVCALASAGVSALYGIMPDFGTPVGFPILNPDLWWNEKWGIGWGLSIQNFIKALPFAVLAVVMWPVDAVAIRTLQEQNYPKEAGNAIFRMDATFFVIALRNIIGVIIGGGQTSAVWRSFMIPLSTVKRPIGGSAFLLGIGGVLFGVLGYPLDIAVFPPLVWTVLIFGVYIPLLEAALELMKSMEDFKVPVVCMIVGLAVNPVLGWVAGIMLENFFMSVKKDSVHSKSRENKLITLCVVFVTAASFLVTGI